MKMPRDGLHLDATFFDYYEYEFPVEFDEVFKEEFSQLDFHSMFLNFSLLDEFHNTPLAESLNRKNGVNISNFYPGHDHYQTLIDHVIQTQYPILSIPPSSLEMAVIAAISYDTFIHIHNWLEALELEQFELVQQSFMRGDVSVIPYSNIIENIKRKLDLLPKQERYSIQEDAFKLGFYLPSVELLSEEKILAMENLANADTANKNNYLLAKISFLGLQADLLFTHSNKPDRYDIPRKFGSRNYPWLQLLVDQHQYAADSRFLPKLRWLNQSSGPPCLIQIPELTDTAVISHYFHSKLSIEDIISPLNQAIIKEHSGLPAGERKKKVYDAIIEKRLSSAISGEIYDIQFPHNQQTSHDPSLQNKHATSVGRFPASVEQIPDVISAADKKLKDLLRANMVFSGPREQKIGETKKVSLTLSLTRSQAELLTGLPTADQSVFASIAVDDVMAAHLSGTSFTINKVTKEKQALSYQSDNQWIWEITSDKPGDHSLYLVVSIFIGEHETPQHLKTFEQSIKVRVTPTEHVLSLFKNQTWQWLWSVILIPLIVWRANRYFGDKTKQ